MKLVEHDKALYNLVYMPHMKGFISLLMRLMCTWLVKYYTSVLCFSKVSELRPSPVDFMMGQLLLLSLLLVWSRMKSTYFHRLYTLLNGVTS